MTLLAKYSELLTKAAEMDAALAEWDEAEMSSAELKYYLEVTTRVMDKLVEAAG